MINKNKFNPKLDSKYLDYFTHRAFDAAIKKAIEQNDKIIERLKKDENFR